MKGTIRLLTSILFVSLIYQSCIRTCRETPCVDRCLTFEGTITYEEDGSPIAGATVEGVYFEDNLVIDFENVKSTTTTDSSGFYSVSFEVFDMELEEDGEFRAKLVEAEEVFICSDILQKIDTDDGDNIDFEVPIIAETEVSKTATVIIKVENLGSLPEGERIVANILREGNGVDLHKTCTKSTTITLNPMFISIPANETVVVTINKNDSNDVTELKREVVNIITDGQEEIVVEL